MLDLGVEKKLINKTGAWFSYGDIRIGQGRENARQFLKDNPEVCEEITQKLRQLIDIANDGSEPVSPDEEEPNFDEE